MRLNTLIRAVLFVGVPVICCKLASAQPLPPIPPLRNLPATSPSQPLSPALPGQNLPPIPPVRNTSLFPPLKNLPTVPKIQTIAPNVAAPNVAAPNVAAPSNQAGIMKSYVLPPIPKKRDSGGQQASPTLQPPPLQNADAPPAPVAAPASSPASGPIIPGPNALAPPTRSGRSRREITIYVDSSVGFDRQSLVNTPTGPLTIDNRRISRLTVTGEYPLTRRTDISVSVPYVYQTARTTSAEGTFRRKGQGIGDMDLYISQRFPEFARGLRFSAGAGVVLPTGQAFNLNRNQLRTGSGFYQPYVHITLRKLMVPLQFYVSADYGTSVARRVDGERINIPNSYGGELGFYYALGPQFGTRSGISYGKTNSPFIGASGSTTAYLRQALSYQTANQTSITASIDAGLTDDSTDAYFSLSAISTF